MTGHCHVARRTSSMQTRFMSVCTGYSPLNFISFDDYEQPSVPSRIRDVADVTVPAFNFVPKVRYTS